MKNLKVSTRLAIGFGVVIALMMVSLLISITRLASQNDHANHEIREVQPKVAAAREISFLCEDSARLVRNLILNKDASALTSNKATLQKNRAKIEDLIHNLDQSVASDKERELIISVKAAHAAYFHYTDDVVGLALANDNQKATDTLYGKDYKTQATYLAALKAMVDYQETMTREGADQVALAYKHGLALLISMGLAALIIGVFAGWLITRGLVKQLGGEPADVVKIAGRIADGELGVAIHTKDGDQSSLLFAIRTMRDGLVTIVGRVRTSASNIATGATQIASGNVDLSSRTEEQASSLEETASSMEELTATVKQNADNAQQASTLAASASDVAKKGSVVVGQVVETMADISTSSSRIAEITGLIEGIAFQTNILALNAAVEAARAGEQGRGFAVVASEVRALAQRSSSAAKEIKDLITTSVQMIQDGSALAGEAGKTMADVTRAVVRLSDIVHEIAAASGEQSRGIEQVNQAITQMDDMTQHNAALVEEATAASKSLEEQGVLLNKAVAFFRLEGVGGDVAASGHKARVAEGSLAAVHAGKKASRLVGVEAAV